MAVKGLNTSQLHDGVGLETEDKYCFLTSVICDTLEYSIFPTQQNTPGPDGTQQFGVVVKHNIMITKGRKYHKNKPYKLIIVKKQKLIK